MGFLLERIVWDKRLIHCQYVSKEMKWRHGAGFSLQKYSNFIKVLDFDK